MFESAEIDHRLSKSEYEAIVPELRDQLLAAQRLLDEQRDKAIVIVVGGVDGAGKGDTINLLQSWLDPRRVRVHGISAPTDEERSRPEYYRFWRRLPPKGTIGVFFGSWHSAPIVQHVLGQLQRTEMDTALERVRHFEKMLSDEGVVLLKLWFHLGKEQQRKRLKKLESKESTRWRVTEQDWKNFKRYDAFADVSARALRETSTEYAPWIIVPGNEPRYRHVTVGRALLAALATPPRTQGTSPTPLRPVEPADDLHVLDTLDLTRRITKKAYEKELEQLQGRLNLAMRSKKFQHRSLVAVFEGWDAAGKGGAIRRITSALDARTYQVVSIAAPSEEERAQPYLWRFFRHVPRHGKAAIFDRSWYGRVLVERVEGFCTPDDWMRAYAEINDFEEQLVESGTVVVKFWLHISEEEQLRRFEARGDTSFKRHKLTDEDWRNREKRVAYTHAVTDLVDRTSTELAPWTLVEAEDKLFARIKVLRTVVSAVEA
ncbi:MAG: polyphosphate:AMP phosphotransferase [Myxococcales bacterium]|nr:polyphosphate:AMP phosphotransferase [Myxococcales bacterium]MCB9628079.1 polyphosphate:AMP phosphotransferase [Sandaracinaceae bacterium]